MPGELAQPLYAIVPSMQLQPEWIRAGEQPGGQDLSKWGRNGRIEAQRALAAAQVTPMATQKEAGRGKSIWSLGAG